MKLYVLRHGETDGNKQDISQGNLDIPLNETGKQQAMDRRDEITKLNIDFIFCSPKSRAKETALLAAPDVPIFFDDRLLSRDHGEFQGKKTSEMNSDEYWNIHQNITYEKAESVAHIYERVSSFLDEMKEKYHDQNILIVTHSGVIRCIYYYFNGLPADGNLYHYESHTASLEMYEC